MVNKIRPSYVSDEHLAYLDKIMEYGNFKMVDIYHCFLQNFPEFSSQKVQNIVRYWASTLSERGHGK